MPVTAQKHSQKECTAPPPIAQGSFQEECAVSLPTAQKNPRKECRVSRPAVYQRPSMSARLRLPQHGFGSNRAKRFACSDLEKPDERSGKMFAYVKNRDEPLLISSLSTPALPEAKLSAHFLRFPSLLAPALSHTQHIRFWAAFPTGVPEELVTKQKKHL